MSEFCSKCDKASESALSVKSTECKLVNLQFVLCEEQRSCAAWGAHASANCAAVTADFQAFPFRLPRRGLCLSPAPLCWLARGAENEDHRSSRP